MKIAEITSRVCEMETIQAIQDTIKKIERAFEEYQFTAVYKEIGIWGRFYNIPEMLEQYKDIDECSADSFGYMVEMLNYIVRHVNRLIERMEETK